jgi:hypothetical protein
MVVYIDVPLQNKGLDGLVPFGIMLMEEYYIHYTKMMKQVELKNNNMHYQGFDSLS